MALIPSYKDFFKAFQSPATNTVGGKHYGVRCSSGRTCCSTTRPRRRSRRAWSALYDPKNKGKITIPDNPIQIADAALYLSKTKPALGITDPYELTKAQLAAAVALLKQQRPAREEVLGARVRPDRPVQERRLDARRVVAVPVLAAPRREGEGRYGHPEGGRHRLARHLDALVQGKASELRVQVDAVHHLAEAAGAAGDLLRRDAGQQEGVRDHGHARRRARARSTSPTPRRATTGRSSSGRRRSPTAATARRTAPTSRRGRRPGSRVKG